MLRQSRGAGGAIAFAGQELGGRPPIELGEVEPDKVAKLFDVSIVTVKLGGAFAGRGAAESGGDGIDKDKVRVFEGGLLVIDDLVGRGRLTSVCGKVDASRPQ